MTVLMQPNVTQSAPEKKLQQTWDGWRIESLNAEYADLSISRSEKLQSFNFAAVVVVPAQRTLLADLYRRFLAATSG